MCTIPRLEFQFILDRLSQFYIANEDFHDFLELSHYSVPLNNYLCFCYGADYTYDTQTPRKIEIFQFVGQIENNRGYYIQSYELPPLEEVGETSDIHLTPSPVYSISDCNYLRQHIFHFQDKTSLFRSTLFYVPEHHKLFRIHCLMSFLTLPLYKLITEKKTYEDVDQMSCMLIHTQKFLISEGKKKQFLHRLQKSLQLCEASIKAHGSLESTLSK